MSSCVNVKPRGRPVFEKKTNKMRDPFTYPYWVSSWARPFESCCSVYQKYAWINNAFPREHASLTSRDEQHQEKQRNLNERLLAGVPQQYRAPSIRLWDAADFPHAVCRACLEAGYWSELPQLVGDAYCPVHGIELQRYCRRCFHPLRFGCPRYGQTGAYVCLACGEPLATFPVDIFRRWNSLSPKVLCNRFADSIAVAQRISFECEGQWQFPTWATTLDQRLILHAITGIRSHLEWDRNWSLLSPEMRERVIPTTFLLPCDDQVLDGELREMQQAIIDDLLKCSQHDKGETSDTRAKVKLKTAFWHELGIKRGKFLLDNVRYILDVLQKERGIGWGIEENICLRFRRFYTEMPCANQIARILVTLAGWQIARVLLWIDSLASKLTACYEQDGILSDEAREILGKQPYGILLRWWRIGEDHFVFAINPSTWIPPYRLRHIPAGIELTVFQIRLES